MRIVLFINFTSGLFLPVMYEANKSFSMLSKCADDESYEFSKSIDDKRLSREGIILKCAIAGYPVYEYTSVCTKVLDMFVDEDPAKFKKIVL